MANLIQLELVNEFAEAIELEIGTVQRTLTGKLLGFLVEGSPVDTGLFRANWQLGIGAAPTGVLKSTAIPDPDLSTIDGGDSVFLVNNVDYAEILEDGGSKQAPNGIVAVSVARLQGEIDATLEELK